MRELIITVQEEGQRLDRYLSRYLPKASSGFLHKMLRKKNIKRNGKKAEGNEKLVEGDRLEIFFSEETFTALGAIQGTAVGSDKEKQAGSGHSLNSQQRKLRSQVKILYRDQDVIALHKPAGMLTQKASAKDDSLNDFLYDYWMSQVMKGKDIPSSFRPSVCNRLDRNTSGIVLCGITVNGLQLLSSLLKNRSLEKYYLCIVKGRLEGRKKVRGFVRKDKNNNMMHYYEKDVPDSMPIETWYEVLDCTDEASLLKVRLITGKSHQIRVHMASLGHPILGDAKYGDREENRSLIKEGIRWQMLHSYEMVFPSCRTGPDTAEDMLGGLRIVDDVPDAFLRLLKRYHLRCDFKRECGNTSVHI